MSYHKRGGFREDAGRPAKAPTKPIRIDEQLADKIKTLTTKLEPDRILEKWDQVENFLMHGEQLNRVPPILLKALEDQELALIFEQIFQQLTPSEFISRWQEINQPLPSATPQKLGATAIPETENTFNATLQRLDVTVEFSDYKTDDGNLLTKEQVNILEAVKQRLTQPQKKGLLIEALAGTGKSTMLAEIAKVLKEKRVSPSQCRFVVFGRKNKDDLKNKLVKIRWGKTVQTLNSLGYEMLREALGKSHNQFNLDRGKYQTIAQGNGYLTTYNNEREEITGTLQEKDSDEKIAINQVDFLELIDKVRLHCHFLDRINDDNIWGICCRYGIEANENRLKQITEAIISVLNLGLTATCQLQHIDFLDQSWVLWHEQNTYKYIFQSWANKLKVISIDECQDVDPLQVNFLKLLHNPSKNFFIAVGDRHQAIYSFRGSMSDGIDVISHKFDTENLPLTTNWRCGKKHLELVREIYPHINIKPPPTSPDGEIRVIRENHFLDIFEKADRSLSFFGICRKNSPLIIFAIRLITAGYAARIKDRNLGAKLMSKIKEVCRNKYNPEIFLKMLESWFNSNINSISKLPDKVQQYKMVELRDYKDCLEALFFRFEPKTFDDWKLEIDRIFDETETQQKMIDLYTIHSGKGGEGCYTFILYPEIMPIEFEK